jgi:hypothetical protein
MEVTEPLQETPGSIGVLTGLRANGITEVVRTICTCAVAGKALVAYWFVPASLSSELRPS